jgi:transcription elongation factor Elf1
MEDAVSYLETKYIHMIGVGLDQFKQKSTNLFNFRCVFCNDSKKSKLKSRGYFYEKKGKMNYRCHNCGAGMSFQNFLKTHDPELYADFLVEKFDNKYKKTPKISNDRLIQFQHQNILHGIPTLIELKANHPAVKYVESRGLPTTSLYDIYYVDNIQKLTRQLPKYIGAKFDSIPRIVLPFRNKNGLITHVQGRAIEDVDKSKRFITLELVQDQLKIFGEDKINIYRTVFVVEGGIDSFFLHNALAMGGADVDLNYFNKDTTIFIYDNEPKSKQIVKRMQKVINAGFRVCIWDNIVKDYNDINDMMSLFKTSEELERYVLEHSYKGLEAQLKMVNFTK